MIKWVITIFLMTIVISGTFSLISDELMNRSGIAVAFIILLVIILIGILFDVVGVAVTSAEETPFHAMASHKVIGAKEALRLLRKAERVSSICNDVVGDICGVISGSASAAIAVQILNRFDFSWPQVVSLLMSALVAGLTVGGKAIGKTFAVNSSTSIVHTVGKVIYHIHCIPKLFRKKKKK
jgi:Mg2+/Co2+ transporter CorB